MGPMVMLWQGQGVLGIKDMTSEPGTIYHCTGKCPVALGGSGGTAPSIEKFPQI